ncbi:MAG: cell wall hydrolase, partial [Devosiaceae bacterium]|nr:cell wall hydrolase [Devosiaceae bacterium]
LSEQLAYSRANTPITERAVSRYSEREQWCLSTGIYFEARGESYRGQVAVAQVILNRVKHRQYPDTICGVVFQNQSWKNRCQFSFACDGIPERVTEPAAWAVAEEITTKVTAGSLYLAEVANATHYHANYVYPHWAPRMKRLTRIGAHIFYRFRS